MGRFPATTRRRLIGGWIALPMALPMVAGAAEPLPATPACADGDEPTPRQTEGPFYTPDSPLRTSFLGDVADGRRLVLEGFVLDRRCRPVTEALVDLWHCDAHGRYDNEGFRLRGHQRTDASGRWRLETIVPGSYPGRTRHIHVKVQRRGGRVLTTQLYFPDEPANAADALFDPALLVGLGAGAGRFDFVLA